jgi:hypothetical protein
MADQLTPVSKLCVINLEGRLSKTDMRKVEKAVKIQLGLSRCSEGFEKGEQQGQLKKARKPLTLVRLSFTVLSLSVWG